MPGRPFRIDVPDEVLDDLRDRLARTRWPEPIPGSGWDYGGDVAYLQDLCAYWADGYDWRAEEARLNGFPQFRVAVDGVDLHLWHVRGTGPQPFPLLLLHGWPGSMAEFLELLGPLTDPAAHGGDAADAFDVVVPALPGFGFGGAPREPGWGPTRMAQAFATLMHDELGYAAYGVQGGDWGGIIGSRLASLHPERVAGLHLNMAVTQPPKEATNDEDAAELARMRLREREETGYSRVQRTRPDALTVAQTDSPAGLAAWIVEKFRAWSDNDGDVESAVARDALLTNLMFYWAPSSTASAARIYRESILDPTAMRYARIQVPTGIAVFPKEPWIAPRSWAEPRYTITRWTEMPRGGHFAALEEPDLLLEDVRAFFRTVR